MSQNAENFDLSNRKVVAMRDVHEAAATGAGRVLIGAHSVVTPSARDFLQQRNIELVKAAACGCAEEAPVSSATGNAGVASAGRPAVNTKIFFSPEAEAIKKEICAVGRKLWMRQFVDGNGGNISYRIGPNEVICTPTLVSKFDLTPEDLCLVDLEGNQLAGARPRTSEIFLHLEIYKAVPEAKAAVHCHPPHATAYAITGRVPPNLVIPEFEVFVGKVAISPYETPGTAEFAQTVLPFVKQHNTVLLSNHGIVCWADTVTHAEWYAEVLETYCWTLMLASQLGVPISFISESKGSDLLAIKKRLGLPDVRLDTSKMKECQLSDLEMDGSIALTPGPCEGGNGRSTEPDFEALVRAVTDAVVSELAIG
ncbi:MAG TPA: class II aldolase/adducin family protein [Terracidiphilus sp.]|nr:class II aldolase/adducin family protein [Terracidiphilus sp.]